MKMHCALCTAFTLKPVGWSLQVTAFATESTYFKLESLVKHVESAKHKKQVCGKMFRIIRFNC